MLDNEYLRPSVRKIQIAMELRKSTGEKLAMYQESRSPIRVPHVCSLDFADCVCGWLRTEQFDKKKTENR